MQQVLFFLNAPKNKKIINARLSSSRSFVRLKSRRGGKTKKFGEKLRNRSRRRHKFGSIGRPAQTDPRAVARDRQHRSFPHPLPHPPMGEKSRTGRPKLAALDPQVEGEYEPRMFLVRVPVHCYFDHFGSKDNGRQDYEVHIIMALVSTHKF